MAGVTFLAFGNGAPDVLASLSASGNAEGGLVMAVSALTGAAFFISGLIVSVVTLTAPNNIVLNKKEFLRDMTFYLLGFTTLIVAGFVGEFNIIFSIVFIATYTLFVVIVFI